MVTPDTCAISTRCVIVTAADNLRWRREKWSTYERCSRLNRPLRSGKRRTKIWLELPRLADKRTLAGRQLLDFRLLGHLECIVHLNSEISDGAFNFCVAQQQLDRA